MKSSLGLSHPPSVSIWSLWPLVIFFCQTHLPLQKCHSSSEQSVLWSLFHPPGRFFFFFTSPSPFQMNKSDVLSRYESLSDTWCRRVWRRQRFPAGVQRVRSRRRWRWVGYGGMSLWCFSDTSLNYFLRYFHSAGMLPLHKCQSVWWLLHSDELHYKHAPRSSIMNSRRKKGKKTFVIHALQDLRRAPSPTPTAPQNSYITPRVRVEKLLKVEGRSQAPC